MTPRLHLRTLLPPAAVGKVYLLGWLPLFLVYLVANETDGDWSRGFRVWPAILGALRGVGPAFLLLVAVWPYTGWMEQRRFGGLRIALNHIGMALVFAAAWHASIFATLWLFYGPSEARRAWENWFIWQSMWGMMMYWAAAGGFTAYRAVERAKQEAAASALAQALLARAELAALRNKLNPHFLFNTLHSIIALTRKQAAAAEKALLMFSDMLRYVLSTEKSGLDHVPLGDELEFVRNYLALEALRLGHRLNVVWRVDEAALPHIVPALSIQPLVENSIQHAFNPCSAAGQLELVVAVDHAAGSLQVTVRDDGPGCTAEALAMAQGLGLKTVSRRLQIEHGTRASLRTETSPGAGFAVHLVLPLSA